VKQRSILAKLQSAPAGSFHVLDPAKAKRMHAKTLYIPSPLEVAEAIRRIPRGETRTIVELRRELAKLGNAETGCPAATIKYWKWLAQATQEYPEETAYAIPWWRVLRDRKPSRHMPGGLERQTALLREEGVEVR
jgi:alkylated DNA nucleotide flippase Atl1